MSQLLFENAWMLAAFGLTASLVAGFLWLQTAHSAGFYTAAVCLAITVLLTLVSLQVETDRERIRKVLSDVAEKLRENDHPAVLRFIHPNAVDGLQRAKSELYRFTFREARITRVKSIEVNDRTPPPTAIAEFNVIVRVERDGYAVGGRIPRFVRVYFMQRDDRWLIQDYEHFEPSQGFRD